MRESGWRQTHRLAIGLAVVLAWIGLLVVGVAYGIYVEFADDLYCEYEQGDSNYGDLSWSVLPPGPRCTWTQDVHGLEATRGPTAVMSMWLLTLGGIAGLGVVVIRPSRGTPPAGAP